MPLKLIIMLALAALLTLAVVDSFEAAYTIDVDRYGVYAP